MKNVGRISIIVEFDAHLGKILVMFIVPGFLDQDA